MVDLSEAAEASVEAEAAGSGAVSEEDSVEVGVAAARGQKADEVDHEAVGCVEAGAAAVNRTEMTVLEATTSQSCCNNNSNTNISITNCNNNNNSNIVSTA